MARTLSNSYQVDLGPMDYWPNVDAAPRDLVAATYSWDAGLRVLDRWLAPAGRSQRDVEGA